MIYDKHRNEATPGARSVCGSCDGELIAKCGTIITHHWAHRAGECDSWSEPESEWHRSWKRFFQRCYGATIEVPIGEHRADVVLPNGHIIELQHQYLSANQIREREQHYGWMSWIYDCHWWRRVKPCNSVRFYPERHPDGRTFFEWDCDLADLNIGDHVRWLHGAKSMLIHQKPVWWDLHRANAAYDWHLPDLVKMEMWKGRYPGIYATLKDARHLSQMDNQYESKAS